ncbi:MAG: type 1 glutamine amidotransferase domain-containing protein [Streptosporangiaceae bacterium]
MPLVDLADDTFIVAEPGAVAARLRDLARWREGGPELSLSVYEDRGAAGLRWTVSGALVGTGEVWLEAFSDGVIVHFYLRADPTRRGSGLEPLRPSSRTARRRARRLVRRYTTRWKRRINALKDELETDRPPGLSRRAMVGTTLKEPTRTGPTSPRGRPAQSTDRTTTEGDVMSLSGKRVLVLAANYFEDTEMLYPIHRLREEDAEVVIAGLDDQPVHGKKGHGPLAVDTTVDQVSADSFDAIVVPGGYQPDVLRRSAKVLDLLRAFDAADKPVALICHAGWVAISADIVKGRRATSFAAIRDDMVNAGADFIDREVVVDRNLITSRSPADLGPWMKALIAALSAA